jgi:uncharacterized protein YjiS (DUF1127 family)
VSISTHTDGTDVAKPSEPIPSGDARRQRATGHARLRLWSLLSAMVSVLFERLKRWEDLANYREFLQRLDDRTLRDIGLTRQEVLRKPVRRR